MGGIFDEKAGYYLCNSPCNRNRSAFQSSIKFTANKTIAKLERKVKSLDDTVDTLNGYVMQLQEKMDDVY